MSSSLKENNKLSKSLSIKIIQDFGNQAKWCINKEDLNGELAALHDIIILIDNYMVKYHDMPIERLVEIVKTKHVPT